MKTITNLIYVALACFALSPTVQAVTPAPDGGYGNQNTAEGDNALNDLTSGVWNTAVGFGALANNTIGNQNTATGYKALFANISGGKSVAYGAQALTNNSTGTQNTATGFSALFTNTTGNNNTANGYRALSFNNGNDNNATGFNALYNNRTGGGNTATGSQALFSNTTGGANTAIGYQALASNTINGGNTAIGTAALVNATGNDNIALGDAAGLFVTTGDDNIDIGNNGVAGDSGTTRIGTVQGAIYLAGIAGQMVGAGGTTCYVDNDGKLGVFLSARRFKTDIADMGAASDVLLALRPVTFRYKPELDKTGIPQFGLVAEEVAKVNPDLVTHDAKGDIYTVRYEAVNAMLLNEFLKEHREVQELKTTVVQQQKQIEALTAGLQKVSAQLEVRKPASQVVENNQ
jgi:endosialidase-like protein